MQRVGVGLTLDDVAAVAGVPDEGIVASAEQRHVIATATSDSVVASAAEQNIGAGAAYDGVVIVAAVDRQIDMAGSECRRIDGVIPAETIDDERVIGRLGPVDRHLRRQAIDVTVVPLTLTVMLSLPPNH